MPSLDRLYYEPLQPLEEPARLDSTPYVDSQNGQRFLRGLGGLVMFTCIEDSEFVTELNAATSLFHFSSLIGCGNQGLQCGRGGWKHFCCLWTNSIEQITKVWSCRQSKWQTLVSDKRHLYF